MYVLKYVCMYVFFVVLSVAESEYTQKPDESRRAASQRAATIQGTNRGETG